MSIKIVKAKRRECAQEVEYRWDPIKKVGRTIPLRHLGLFKPLNPERYVQIKLSASIANDKIKK